MESDSLCIIGMGKTETNIRLIDEAKKAFGSVFFVPLEAIDVGLSDEFAINYRVTNLLKFKAVMPRIPRMISSYAYQLLSLFPEDTYMPIRPISFLLVEERFFLLSVLRKRDIETLNLSLLKSPKAATRIIEDANFPIVIRTPNKKTGIVVNNSKEAKGVIEALGSLKQSILIEDLVKDMVSVYIAYPDVIAATRKKSKEKDVVFGEGEYKKFKLDIKTKQLALDAAKAIEAHVCRIDIGINGEPQVVNVSLNPDLVSPSKVVGADLPALVIENIRKSYDAHKEKPMLMKFFDDAKSVVNEVMKTKKL